MVAPLALTNGDVLLLIVVVAIPAAAIAFIVGAGSALRQIGKGQFAIEQELPQRSEGVSLPASSEVREAEIRQMVEAKAYRQQARGETPLDIDAEIERQLRELENLGQ